MKNHKESNLELDSLEKNLARYKQDKSGVLQISVGKKKLNKIT